jgi:TfoX/Sxy family transcriptional regulator of competence genes
MTVASDALAKRIRPLLARRQGIVEKKMFGGTGFMLNGNMAVGTTAKGDMLVRVDPRKQDVVLKRPGAYQMSMGERAMTGFVAVAAVDLADIDELKGWVTYGLDYAKLLPAK